MRLRKKDLAPVLDEYRGLPEADRKPKLEDSSKATPPRRAVPKPPAGGLVVRGYCTYIGRQSGKVARSKKYYYKENPDRWAAETQSDMLWLTEAEWKSLVPGGPKERRSATVRLCTQPSASSAMVRSRDLGRSGIWFDLRTALLPHPGKTRAL